MVVFQADEIHFCNSMKAMNGLRHDKSFCDVRLIVGMDSVHAHKCVLAAGSSYFRSLFLGKFTEATLEDINLSEVTDSVEALELILDFIYTGEIDIDCYNLGIIVKLSSFFLVETLREFCISFMKKNSGVNMEQQQQPEIRREPIMDLFAYVPNTESWHHIQEFTQDIEPISCVLDEMLWGLWQMAIFQDELIFLNCILEEMNLYSLKTKTWRWLPFDVQIEGLLEANEFCNDFCVTCGSDGTMYLIGKIKLVSNDDEPLDLNFKGFKFDPSDMTWRQIFQTDNFDFPVSELRLPQIHAKVSSASNELLFTYARQEEVGTCWNMAYVVNLDDENLATSCTQLLAAYQTSGDMLFCGINIMEGKNCFFIISNGTDGGKVQVKYEYKFRSHRLVELNSTEKHVSVIEPHFHRARYFDNDVFPCWSEQSVTDMDTLWYFEGNLDKVSAFTEVTLNRSKNPVIKRHPPPPFTCVAALWAGSVSADLFINKHPVSSFPFVE